MKKVNISKVILYGIYLVLAANLEIFKVFGEGFFLGNINRYVILSVLFSIFVIAIVLAYKKKIPLFIWLLIFPIVVRMSIAVYYVNVRGFERYNALQYCMCYYCIMLAVPIYYLLRYQVITLRKLMDVSIKLLFVSFFLKSFVSIFNFMTGKIIFPAFIWNDTWYRYGFLRLQPPALANISIVMGMFMYYTEEKKSKRLQYLLCVLVTLLYSAIIHASRFTLLWQLAVLIYMVMIKRNSPFKRICLVTLIIVVICYFVSTGTIGEFLDTFNTTNKTYGGSTFVRFTAIGYYMQRFFEDPFMGTGILGYAYSLEHNIMSGGMLVGDLTDIGYLYSVVQFGIIMIIMGVLMIFRILQVGFKARKMKQDSYCILLWGIAACLVLGNISIDMYMLYAISVPLVIAVTEYVNYELLTMKRETVLNYTEPREEKA